MPQIKEVINNFCKLLHHHGFSSLSAEDLRLAKFNKSCVVEKLWILLHELTEFIKAPNANLNNKFKTTSPESAIKEIKIEMLKLGYQCQDFLNSTSSLNPSDQESSSRDLLLASGWLISTQELTDVMISEMQSLVDDEYYKLKHYENPELQEAANEAKFIQKAYKDTDRCELELKLSHLKRLDGKFKYKLNSYYSCLVEKSKLSHELHAETTSAHQKGPSNLSCLDLYLIKHQEEIPEFERQLEKKIECLTLTEFWLENEEYFWEWMESVMDEKIASESHSNENNLPNLTQIYQTELEATIESKFKIESAIKYLKEYRMKLKESIEKDPKCFKEDIGKFAKDNHTELENFEDKIQNELKSILNSKDLKKYFLTENLSDLLDINGVESRLIYEKKEKCPKKVPSQKINFPKVSDKILELENKIKFLSAFLEKEKSKMSRECEKKINDLKECYIVYSN